MNQKCIMSILFWSMFMTVPVVVFLLVAGSFMPLFALTFGMLQSMDRWDSFDVSFMFFTYAYILVYIRLFLWIANRLSRILFMISTPMREIILVGLIFAILSIGFAPIYGSGSVGGGSGGHNLFDLIRGYL